MNVFRLICVVVSLVWGVAFAEPVVSGGGDVVVEPAQTSISNHSKR